MSDLPDSYYINPAVKDKGFVKLKCKSHPHLQWYTKNIAPIGCRTIFTEQNEECDCPLSDLAIA